MNLPGRRHPADNVHSHAVRSATGKALPLLPCAGGRSSQVERGGVLSSGSSNSDPQWQLAKLSPGEAEPREAARSQHGGSDQSELPVGDSAGGREHRAAGGHGRGRRAEAPVNGCSGGARRRPLTAAAVEGIPSPRPAPCRRRLSEPSGRAALRVRLQKWPGHVRLEGASSSAG